PRSDVLDGGRSGGQNARRRPRPHEKACRTISRRGGARYRGKARRDGRQRKGIHMMKKWFGAIALAVALSWSRPAAASSYFATAALLLDETHRSDDWMQSHYGDQKLADILHQLSEARV